jgi:hypothetical protein
MIYFIYKYSEGIQTFKSVIHFLKFEITSSKEFKFCLAGKRISKDLFFLSRNTSVLVRITGAVVKSISLFAANVQAIPHLQ